MSINFDITDTAAERIKDIIKQQNLDDGHFFRLTVEGGGCNGFQYKMDMDNTIATDDLTFIHNNAQCVIDALSAPFLDGSTLDYQSTLGGSMMKVINPNATSSCGCGVSFNV